MVMRNESAPQHGGGHQEPDRSVNAPGFLAGVAAGAHSAHALAAARTKCPCAQCALLVIYDQVAAFMLSETLRAAVTGDTTALDMVATKVKQIQAAR